MKKIPNQIETGPFEPILQNLNIFIISEKIVLHLKYFENLFEFFSFIFILNKITFILKSYYGMAWCHDNHKYTREELFKYHLGSSTFGKQLNSLRGKREKIQSLKANIGELNFTGTIEWKLDQLKKKQAQ